MTWTDERVALLKKLWMDGLSASQIASELSGGVTRNAVIGKVHRLKLSARAKPSAAAPRPKPPRTAPRRPSSPSVSGGARLEAGTAASVSASALGPRRSTSSAPMIGATALRMEETPEVELEVNPRTAEIFIPPESRIGLLELTERTCKWPIGDPVAADFHFCGRASEEGKPYCEFHARKAFHQIDRKKR